MGCEESFITIKLIWHGYLVSSLGICVHETPTETGLTPNVTFARQKNKFTLLASRKQNSGQDLTLFGENIVEQSSLCYCLKYVCRERWQTKRVKLGFSKTKLCSILHIKTCTKCSPCIIRALCFFYTTFCIVDFNPKTYTSFVPIYNNFLT